jgi:hypothetical protein
MPEQLDISLVERQRCAIELYLAWKKWIGGTPLEHPSYSPDPAPHAFPSMKRELRGEKFRSDQRSAAHFRDGGGAL